MWHQNLQHTRCSAPFLQTQIVFRPLRLACRKPPLPRLAASAGAVVHDQVSRLRIHLSIWTRVERLPVSPLRGPGNVWSHDLMVIHVLCVQLYPNAVDLKDAMIGTCSEISWEDSSWISKYLLQRKGANSEWALCGSTKICKGVDAVPTGRSGVDVKVQKTNSQPCWGCLQIGQHTQNPVSFWFPCKETQKEKKKRKKVHKEDHSLVNPGTLRDARKKGYSSGITIQSRTFAYDDDRPWCLQGFIGSKYARSCTNVFAPARAFRKAAGYTYRFAFLRVPLLLCL